MKKILLLCFFTTSLLFGKSITLMHGLNIHDDTTAGFMANRDMGRAWVELTHSYDSLDWDDEISRIKVEGLKYLDGEIVYEDENGTIVCANEKSQKALFGRRIIGYSYITIKTNCSFEVQKRMLPWDDGFYVRTREHLTVKLNILN